MIFSIGYEKKEGIMHVKYNVDWNWAVKDQWARSKKMLIGWKALKGIDQDAYNAIMHKFGQGYKFNQDISLEKMLNLSPNELMKLGEKTAERLHISYNVRTEIGPWQTMRHEKII